MSEPIKRVNNTAESNIDLHREFDYAPIPAIIVDTVGNISRINVALRTLFEAECNDCCYQHYTKLAARLVSGETKFLLPSTGMIVRRQGGDVENPPAAFDTSDLQVQQDLIEVRSQRFGELSLFATEMPHVSSLNGNWMGSTIWFEIYHSQRNLPLCRKSIAEALSRELLWDLYATSYDHILPEMFFYRETLDRHCALLSDTRIQKVVDIGAGTGLQMERLLNMSKSVTAVEISRAMLSRLRLRAEKASTTAIQIVEETATNLSQLLSSSFDAATILLAFFDMDNPWKALKEAQRLIRPGGVLVFTEPKQTFDVASLMQAGKNSLIASGAFSKLAVDWNRIETVAPLIRNRIADTQKTTLDESTSVRWSAETACEALKDEGYHDVRMIDSHLGNCATVYAVKP